MREAEKGREGGVQKEGKQDIDIASKLCGQAATWLDVLLP